MKFFLKVLISLLILINNSFLLSQELSKDEKEILELQDKRTLGENEKLITYLLSIDSNIRVRALIALANIGDSNYVSKCNFLLAGPFDTYPTISDLKSCAFMLGQINSAESRKMIELMLNTNVESLNDAQYEFVNAIGKIGDEHDMQNLISKNFQDMNLSRALAMSLGRFALRKIKNQNSVETLKQLAKINDSMVQRNTSFSIWRTGDKDLLENVKYQIYSDDPQTRMWAMNSAGKMHDNLLLLYMLEEFSQENDWRVKVNMLNSLGSFKIDSVAELTERIYSVLSDGIGDENEHVSLTAINVLGKLFADLNKSNNDAAKSLSGKLKEEFKYALDSVPDLTWRQKSELITAMSLIYRDEVKGELLKTYSKTDDYNFKSEIVKAIGNFNNGMIYKEIRDTISADVQRYNTRNPNTTGDMIGSKDLAKLYRGFVEMLSNLDEKVDEENQNTMRLIFTEFASSKDPLIVDISLNALKDSLYLKYRDETVSVMGFDYSELENPKDNDVNLIFIDAMKDLYDDNTIKILENNLNSDNYEIGKSSAEALEKITEKKYEFTAKQKYDFDWDYIESLDQKKFITVKTNKGNIKIELLPDIAPFTVMNFLKLAEKNYYDNTVFHRVVSNFVIQGGDPTSTGYGGPGYSIRSEFSPLTYERGMVGMASSGKDTEGSQFFITHSATPHLDGKYTIFGKVTKGMDVVDKIMIGDFIEDIEIK